MGMAIGMVPMASAYALEQMLVFATLSLSADINMLAEVGFNRYLVPKSLPCIKTIEALLREFSSIVYLSKISKILRAPAKFLALDKSVRGKTVNKVSHLSKLICYQDPDRKTQEIDAWCFDSGGSEGSSEDCTEAISHAISTKLLGCITEVNDVAGDNGGGDSGKPLAVELEKLGLVSLNLFVIANCNHHNLNLLQAPAIAKTMGEGGLDRRNFLQLGHAKKDLQDAHKQPEWKAIVRVERHIQTGGAIDKVDVDEVILRKGYDVKAKGEPTTTRWEGAGMAAKESQDETAVKIDEQLARGVMQRDPTKKAANKIASGIISLYREMEIKTDEKLVSCYHDMILGWAYNAFKARERHSKKSGFLSENVLPIHSILVDRLNQHSNGRWRTRESLFGFDELNSFIEESLTVEKLNASMAEILADGTTKYNKDEASQLRERQQRKVNKLLKIGCKQAKKHFQNWANGQLLLCALGCEYGFVAQVVAIYLCSKKNDDNNDPFSDIRDKRFLFDDFNTVEWVKATTSIDYLEDNCTTLDEIRQSEFFNRYSTSIELISLGGKLWTDDALSNFRDAFYDHFLTIPSTNQITELMFKMLTDIATVHCRSESDKTLYLAISTGLVQRAKRTSHQQSLLKPRQKRKRSKAIPEHDKKSNRICQQGMRGTLLSTALIDKVENHVRITKQLNNFGANRSKLMTNITIPEKDFKFERVKKKVLTYINAKSNRQQDLNARAKETGTDITDFISGRLLLSLITRVHLPFLRDELRMQGLIEGQDFDDTTTITDLKKLLKKKLDLKEKDKSFKPMSQTLFDVCNGMVDNIIPQLTITPGNDDEDNFSGNSTINPTCQAGNQTIALSALKVANNIAFFIREELIACNVAIDNSVTAITKLKKLLRECLGNPKLKTFEPMSSALIDVIEKVFIDINNLT